MIVRELRLEKGWSQEDLAQLSGLSVRTIQRIERGNRPGVESLKSLAAVFETDFNDLIESRNPDEEEAREYVENLKGFHINWIAFVIVVPCLYLFNIFDSPDEIWVWYTALSWLMGIALHWAVLVVLFGGSGFFGADWEKRRIEKRLNRPG